jgi:hypothetical protein
MSARHPNRERPVISFNRSPRRGAYACFTEDDYKAAERFFNLSYLARERKLGPWTPLTNACLNNWIIALIKVHQYERAETICTDKLQYLASVNMQRSACFICIQCSLACSLFLSGDIVAAEDLYDEIRAHQDTITDVLAQDAFDVLSLVRLTQNDCLVFRDSCTSLSVLVPVTDYITQLDGLRPKKNLLLSGLGSLRRLTLLSPRFRQEEDSERVNDEGRPLSLIKRVFCHDKGTSRSPTPFDLHRAELTLPPTAQQSERPTPCLHSQEILGVLDPVQEEDASQPGDTGADWLGYHIETPPIPALPQAPAVGPASFDLSMGNTYRSVDTTTSSVRTIHISSRYVTDTVYSNQSILVVEAFLPSLRGQQRANILSTWRHNSMLNWTPAPRRIWCPRSLSTPSGRRLITQTNHTLQAWTGHLYKCWGLS